MNYVQVKHFAAKHSFGFAVLGAVIIGMLMTLVSMSLYFSSGAAQLDLSRPGYEDVRAEVQNAKPVAEYSPSGPINEETLDEFQQLYDEQRDALSSLSDYDDRALSDVSLRIE